VFRPLEKHSLAVYDEERMTVMVVTHEMGFARKGAQRVVFMDAGAIVESGAPNSSPIRKPTGRVVAPAASTIADRLLPWVEANCEINCRILKT